MLGINKGGRDEGCAGGCAYLSKMPAQMYFQACVHLFEFSPRFSHGLCINFVQKFSECLLLALALLQYCCVVKHDVS